MDKDEATELVSPEMALMAEQRARDRARSARWDLDVAIFLFGILAIMIILLFQGIAPSIVAYIAIFGLAMVWLVGWRRGRQLYPRFYEDELARLMQETRAKGLEETIEEKVQKALRQRM